MDQAENGKKASQLEEEFQLEKVLQLEKEFQLEKALQLERVFQRKKRFQKIFAVLVIVLLALTFLSKSFYNYRLPVVTATLPRQGRLIFTVEGTSEFVYAYTESVYADIDGKIREILADVGDEVKAGQTLMRVERNGTGEMYDVRADKDGIVSWIGVSKGIYVSSVQNTVLYEIAEKSEEWVCGLVISEEQFEHISMESVPVLELVDQNESVEGEISSISGYESQDLQGYKVNITVRRAGAPLAGERVKITIREEGELYDTLIPAAALCKDATGYYVLVMRENDSVLGEGYKAHRMSVDLLDSDEACCAVRGLPADELVIIASTSEIADGSNVFYEGDGTQ